MTEAARRREIERWVAWIRLGGVVFAVLQIAFFTQRFPPGYLDAAWALTGAFAAGTVLLFWLARAAPDGRLGQVGLAAIAFDTAVVATYGFVFSYEYGNQARFALVAVVVEAALRYGLAGGVILPVLLFPVFWLVERWRVHYFRPPGPAFLWDRVTFPPGLLLLTGLIVGWLVRRLNVEVQRGGERAAEAERLRDALGRRVDVLEAANR